MFIIAEKSGASHKSGVEREVLRIPTRLKFPNSIFLQSNADSDNLIQGVTTH
jgi:hypothetical protein